MNLIKYSGSKLYCSQLKRTVTIKDVVKGIQAGVTLKVTCARTRRDITSDVLQQAALLVGIPPKISINIIRNRY